MDRLSLGTYKMSHDEAIAAVKMALDAGITHFDTAALYKTETAVGATASTASHITTKVHPRQMGTAKAAACIAKSCAALPHIDVLMLHRPYAWNASASAGVEDYQRLLRETWSVMEDAVDCGKVRALGVSNMTTDQLENLLTWARIKPIVIQEEYHPLGKPSPALLAVAAAASIDVQAYSPFGGDGAPVLADPAICDIATEVGCTPAQVVISWLLHHRAVRVAFRGGCARYIQEAVDAADTANIHLTSSQYAILDGLDCGLKTCPPSRCVCS
jgi:glycerol 2-dehydrogenase (NADP+)